MLENLTKNITKIFSNISEKKKLSEDNIKDILNKLRKSLIEADVAWSVTKIIINNIKHKLTNIEITKKTTPGNILLKVVNEEFTNILDENKSKKENLSEKTGFNKILLVGLQGSGKTTSLVKLGKYLKTKNKKPLLISCDIHRPAATEQMTFLAKKASIECFLDDKKEKNIEYLLKKAIDFAKNNEYDYLLIDSAGRTHLDNEMMEELNNIIKISKPEEILFVLDSMIGQNILEIIENFSKKIKISGFLLSKVDSDAKGGAVISLGYSTKIPIKFIGTGENINDIEIFNPKGIASRILGMGDLTSIIENFEIEKNNLQNQKEFNLQDLQNQMKQIIELNSLKNIIEKFPGAHLLTNDMKEKNDKNFKKLYSIMNSMTKKEKQTPEIINGSRKKRIAAGAGVDISSINKLLKIYKKSRLEK